ncbi:conserved hypothetical protein [Hyphomicrobiales bacterium]|nr:conserved hypothetical protein [Hyphomicrobiales bacterium]CAH1699559.1 conserved hypothetical protein [Hyphomicrobiales bacterium]CAI0343347.1 conserved hypothetical protein [Hyphomicrobiales bacterium]
MDSGVFVAIRLLPRHKKEVEELALASEDFRGLCRDLADAENFLVRLEKTNSNESDGRRAEYRNLVSELEAELCRAVQERQYLKNYPR